MREILSYPNNTEIHLNGFSKSEWNKIYSDLYPKINYLQIINRSNPFVQFSSFNSVTNELSIENIGINVNQIIKWLNRLNPNERKEVAIKILFYLSYALLLMQKSGKRHLNLLNPNSVYVIGDSKDFQIKIMNPKDSGMLDKPNADMLGIINIMSLTYK